MDLDESEKSAEFCVDVRGEYGPAGTVYVRQPDGTIEAQSPPGKGSVKE